MKAIRLTATFALAFLIASSLGAAVTAQTSRSPRDLPRSSDPTPPTVVDQSPERERFEREFGMRRRYWRPVLRVGHCSSLVLY